MVRLSGLDKYFRYLKLIILLVFIITITMPISRVSADGAAGFSLSYDGVDDFVLISETDSVMGGTTWKDTMTVSLWMKPEGSGYCLVNDPAQCDAIVGDRPRWWGISHGVVNGVDRIWFWNMDVNGQDQIGIPYTAGEWVHLAWVHSGGTLSAYKNGVLVDSITSGTTRQPDTGALPAIQIGAVINNVDRNWSFQGEIDEVRLYDIGLTQSAIRDTIFTELTPPVGGLRAYYKMSDGTGTTLTDDSGNGFDGTLMDGTSTVPGNGSYPLWVVSTAFDQPVAYDLSAITDEDTSVQITLDGLGAPPSTLTYTFSEPPHGSLSGTAPDLTYMPDLNYSGADSFTYQVWDGVNASASATVSITINPINDAPVVNSQNWNSDEDVAGPIVLTANDIEGDPLTYSLVGTPTYGVLSGTIPNFTYTPNSNYFGPDSFSFKVNDTHVDSQIATVSITVNPVNDAPLAENLIKNTQIDTPVDITLLASDIENDPLTFSIVDNPGHGSLSGSIPNLTYTPVGGYSGSDSFTYLVNDTHVDSALATVNINISSGNQAPTADDQIVETDEDVFLDIILTGSDPESSPITFTILDQPLHGVVSGTGPNVNYSPALNYNGSDHFTFKVNDGLLDSSIATVTISVLAVNDQPVATPQDVETNVETALPITLSGTDIENNTLTFSVETDPGHGILSGSAPDLTYTPAAGYSGPDSFTFIANDGLIDSSPATISITVVSPNQPPTADAQEVETDEEIAIDIILTGNDPEGEPLSFSFMTPPAHGNFGSTTPPNLTYTPQTNYYGTDFFVFRVHDGVQWSEPATVSIVINPVNDLPRGLNQILETDQNVALDVLLTGEDVDGDFLTFEIFSDPAHGTLSGTLPNVVYTPDLNYTGQDNFRFRVSDSGGTVWSSLATISINVVAVNNPPTAVPDEYSVVSDHQLVVNAPGVLTNDSDINGDVITAELVSDVSHGNLTLVNDGSFTYVPSIGYTGDDQFTYRAKDTTEYSTPVTVTIHVVTGYQIFLPLITK